MKRFFLCALLAVAMAGTLHSEEKKDWREECEAVSDIAGKVMTARQENVEMAIAIGLNDSEYYHKIIIDAYNRPRFATQSIRYSAINDFKNSWYLKCADLFKANGRR